MSGTAADKRRSDLLALFQEVGAAVTSTLVLEETLALIAERVGVALGVFECDLYEYDPETNTLRATAFWSLEPTPEDEAWVGAVVDLADRPSYREILARREIVEDHLDDPGLDEQDRRLMAEWDEKTTLTVPLVFREEAIGCLVLIEKRSVRRFTDEERELVAGISVPAAIAIHNARMYRRQESRARELASLLDASRAITSTVVLDDVLALVAEKAAQALGSPECLIYEYDREQDAIVSRSLCTDGDETQTQFEDSLGTAYPLADYPSDRAILEGGEIVEEHQSDSSLQKDSLDTMAMWDEKTCLNVPLLFRGEPLGLLILIETKHERHFSPGELELVRGLAEQAAVAIHNARLFQRRETQNRRLVTLLQASQAITASLDADEVLARIAVEVGNLFPGVETSAEVWLRADDGLYLPFEARSARGKDRGAELARAADTTVREAVERLEPVQNGDGDGGRRLVVPLVLNKRVEGYIDVRCHRAVRFDDDEVQVLQILVNHAAVAFENADNYGKLEVMYFETVTALAAAMEAKDHYTAEHADMLASMAVAVGRRLDLSESQLRDLQYAAVLHDIGKIGVPGHILNKPARLTDEEFRAIAEHTIIGERIISHIEYLAPIGHIIRSAHERWDGKGYPDSLAGEKIPLAARILLVCDAYHAMTSDRPYREAMPDDDAVSELRLHAGTQFDPRVVDAFLRVWPRFDVSAPEPFVSYARGARD